MDKIICGNSLEEVDNLPDDNYSCLICSPPYNVGKNYGNGFNDNKHRAEYFGEIDLVFEKLKSKMKYDSLLFVNMANSSKELTKSHQVASLISEHFNFIQTIIWVKSISLEVDHKIRTIGQYSPRSDDYGFHSCFEYLFVFSPNPKMKFKKLQIGIPFQDETNIDRYGNGKNLKSRGDVWFVKYKTVGKNIKKNHPAIFPKELSDMCLKVSPEGPVIDPYAGTLTVLLSAQELGRDCTCIEQNKQYIIESINRNNLTNYELKGI